MKLNKKLIIGISVILVLIISLYLFSSYKKQRITGSFLTNVTDMHKEYMKMYNATRVHINDKNFADIDNFKIEIIKTNFEAGIWTQIKFNITNVKTKKGISDFDINHKKILHLIMIRDDLHRFDHLHPDQIEPGLFSLPYLFRAPGRYREWIEFSINNTDYIVDFDVNVTGNKSYIDARYEDDVNVRFTINIPDNIEVNKTYVINFTVTNVTDNKPFFITEKYLGASAHMIEIDETLEEFEHIYDENFDKDNIISFTHVFKKQGAHKMWIQLSVHDIPRTVYFNLIVR